MEEILDNLTCIKWTSVYTEYKSCIQEGWVLDRFLCILISIVINYLMLLEVPAANQESEWSCICVLFVSILPDSTISQLDFGTVLMLWHCLVFHLFNNITYNYIFLDLTIFTKLHELKKNVKYDCYQMKYEFLQIKFLKKRLTCLSCSRFPLPPSGDILD